MANWKISQLDAYPNASLGASDIMEVSYWNGANFESKKVSRAQLIATFSGGGGSNLGNADLTSTANTRKFTLNGSLSTNTLEFWNSTVQLVKFSGNGTTEVKDTIGNIKLQTTNTDAFLKQDFINFIQFGSENKIFSQSKQFIIDTVSNRLAITNSGGPTSFHKGTIQMGIFADPGTANNCVILNNGTAPSINLGTAGYIYVEGGALKYRGGSGTVTTIAIA